MRTGKRPKAGEGRALGTAERRSGSVEYYQAQSFTSDAKRVEYLFELYEEYPKGAFIWAAADRGEKPKRTKS